ncbi:exodeoxyribonuclease VII large subunit [Corticicoccus populi]|uniref:Exodeoxyribonuclease 7 large subunit n=1 Tax=Corticicoccus populi TaxID=1812821 RepID=A0ABW5WU58_9STAP
MESSNYLSVQALTKYLKYKFDQDPYLTRVFLKGELSNVKKHTSDHIYFAVKDNASVIRGMMFKQKAGRLSFDPVEGQSVLIEGRVSIFETSGQYQIYADSMQIDGIGMLFEQLEKDKKELQQKGFFNAEHKQPLPKYPSHIAVVTSETSAAMRDMLTTIERRYPVAKLTIINTLMQGSGSRDNVIQNLKKADELNADVIILARGGGSIEDLWTFNDKEVAVNVFNTNTPIITAIGHETDTTLVDYVSDLRAATPTAASEIAVPDMNDLLIKIEEARLYIYKRTLDKIRDSRNNLSSLSNYYKLRSPELLYDQETQRLIHLNTQLNERMRNRQKDARYYSERLDRNLRYLSPLPEIRSFREQLHHLDKSLNTQMNSVLKQSQRNLGQILEMLDSLSPTAVLKRGYSFTTKDDKLIKSTDDVKNGDYIKTTFREGTVTSQITEVNRND